MPPKAIFFDFMGTCLNWHKSVVQSISPSPVSEVEASRLAIEWRRQYFLSNAARLHQQLPPEDIDETLARTLVYVLDDFFPNDKKERLSGFDDDVKRRAIEAWHKQPAWPDVPNAIRRIRSLGIETFVHANGTTRLQLDLVRSSGLEFDMLFSSQLLGVYKPSLKAYEKALQLVKLKPEDVVMVAAHAYDLRGAKNCGMRTVYIQRWTDDVDEDMSQVRGEFDVFLESMEGLSSVIDGM